MAIYQVLVRLLDGKTRCLNITYPCVTGYSLKLHLHGETLIPPQFLRLVSGFREIRDETLLSAAADGSYPSCTLLLRLPGGKGGFGSLLRGAATKAGQKKTSNFDACRDMSGRRLRHVNAEKKLEEWKAEAEVRKLEKVAEQFLKKKAKEVKKRPSGDVEKYIQKYKEESERCMEEVEESVKQSFMLYEKSKRKVLSSSGPASKRVKLWLGKEKVDESDDSEDSDDEDDTEKKSVVIDTVNQWDGEGSSGTTSGRQTDGESLGEGSEKSIIEDDNGNILHSGIQEVGGSSEENDHTTSNDGSLEPEVFLHEDIATEDGIVSSMEQPSEIDKLVLISDGTVESNGMFDCQQHDQSPIMTPTEPVASSMEVDLVEATEETPVVKPMQDESSVVSPVENPQHTDTVNHQMDTSEVAEAACEGTTVATKEKSLNFEEFNTAAELESFGMDRLKTELQERGLKCGGTLQERAARLFLLNTTPLERLPKKLFAKPGVK